MRASDVEQVQEWHRDAFRTHAPHIEADHGKFRASKLGYEPNFGLIQQDIIRQVARMMFYHQTTGKNNILSLMNWPE